MAGVNCNNLDEMNEAEIKGGTATESTVIFHSGGGKEVYAYSM